MADKTDSRGAAVDIGVSDAVVGALALQASLAASLAASSLGLFMLLNVNNINLFGERLAADYNPNSVNNVNTL
ncbi:MAG: hypothetical protein KTR33_02105 [Gammaproteobacteria bacterium]|nr:hypothetical protein [Gammaproteobacteria bacterium]